MTAEVRVPSTRRRILPEEEAAPIRRLFRKVEAEYRLLEREWDRLLPEHEGQWVAVNGRQFLFDDSLEELIAAARAKNWPLGTIAVDLLLAARPPVILAD